MRLRLQSDYNSQKAIKSRGVSIQNNDFLIIQKFGCVKYPHSKQNKKEEKSNIKQKKTRMSNLQLFMDSLPKNKNHISSLQLIKPIKHIDYKYVTLSELLSPNFPTLSYSVKEIISFTKRIMSLSSFSKKFGDKMVQNLIIKISEGYKNVPYHNFSHGFSLMLLNHQCLIKQKSLKHLISDEEYLYILIAGLAHDIGHKGTNNMFEIKCKSQLAKESGNKAVLENMHIRLLWKVLEDHPECNFLNISTNPAKTKHIITRLILNTDMAAHFDNVELLKKMKSEIDFNKDQHKWFILEQMFHACDIGNSTQEFDNCMNWSSLISYQFNQQAKLQQQLNLEVTKPFIYTDIKGLYKDQIWFLGQIVQPLWKEIESILPNLKVYCKNIENNLEKVKALNQL